jgi:hypothetical protein
MGFSYFGSGGLASDAPFDRCQKIRLAKNKVGKD